MATKIGQLTQELAASNPWWRDSEEWYAADPDLRAAKSSGLNYESHVLDDLTPAGLHILRGPRRVGKTVSTKQTIRELIRSGVPPRSIIRVAVDGWNAKDLRTVTTNAAIPRLPQEQPLTWFIDEVTSVSGDWAAQIKWLRDNDLGFSEATVVLTGSNAAGLTEAAGPLAGRRGGGRSVDRLLLPISFRSFVDLIDEAPPDLPLLGPGELRSDRARTAYNESIAWIDHLVSFWETYLQYGGFPRAVAAAARGQSIPETVVQDIFDMVAGDAFGRSRLPAPKETALLERLWSSMASPINMTTVARDIGVTRETVAKHIEYLRDAYLLWMCPQRAPRKWVAREKSQPKLYAIDPLVARLAHLRNSSRADVDLTVLNEMQMGLTLRRAIQRQAAVDGDEFLFYVRTPARKEIDFVSEHLAGTALESKYVEGGHWVSEARTVNASPWEGVMGTRNVLDMESDATWAVPTAVLAYLLGG